MATRPMIPQQVRATVVFFSSFLLFTYLRVWFSFVLRCLCCFFPRKTAAEREPEIREREREEEEQQEQEEMATRPMIPQQARGGGVKQLEKLGGDGRTRRALGDIGNLVSVRAVEDAAHPQISRPITRSFCARFLANSQAAAAAENNKKCARQVKNNVPDNKSKNKEVAPIASKKKPQRTLTSVLTARSKAACGVLVNKPKEKIVDIDAADAYNHLYGVEYVEDIYKFYKLVENESRPHDYMHSQIEINEKMRAILVDWLVGVHLKFELSHEAFYLTINIIDRFLAVKIVPRGELQLVGMSALLMASKYEEILAPEVNDLVCIADRVYSHEQLLTMEKTILGKLEWTLTVPTHYVFLVRFIKASIPDKELESLVYFLAELGMMNYDTIMFCPSMVAASAVYAARCTLNKTPLWTETLKLHTGFSEAQLMDCAKLLVHFHSKVGESKLLEVHKKYSNRERGSVALLPPAKNLLSGDVSTDDVKTQVLSS